MTTYRYEGISSSGAKLEGVIDAFDEAEALIKAKENCRIVVSVKPVKSNTGLNTDIGELLSGGKINNKELALLCSQLAIELKAGLPLVRSLQLASENVENKSLQKILAQVSDDVHAGHGLADSFSVRGPQLPNTFIETIRAGEASGKLDDCFTRLKKYYENQAAVASKVLSAMIYPIMLIIVAIVVVAIIMIKAVPVFSESFASMGNELPVPTKALIALSEFFVHYWLVFLIFILAFALFIKLFGKTESGQSLYSKLALTFPGVNMITKMSSASNFCSTMSTMLSSGLPLIQALQITADVTNNLLISNDISAARQGVIEGHRMGDGLRNSNWLPKLLVEMTSVGEETGNLEETLDVVCEYYTNEVDTAVQRALGILEPCIILVLAALVVFILLSVYLPLFSMYGTV